MGDFFKIVFFGLIPPDLEAEPKLIQRWRINVSITLGILVMGTGLFAALAFGFMTFIFPGFALASDIKDTKSLLQQVRMAQLDSDIFSAHEKECEAITARNRDLAYQLEQRVQEKLPYYQRLNNGQPYQLQACPSP